MSGPTLLQTPDGFQMASEPDTGSRAIRTTFVAGGAAVVGTLPVFLVGSLAGFVMEDIGFDQAQLGLAVACFFMASAMSAYPGGRISERVGARLTMLISIGVSFAASLAIAVVTRTWLVLVICLVLAGVANGVIQPAGNLALAQGVPRRRHGLAFGVKQASIPASTMAAGAAVPLIGLTVGWRWAFVGATVAAGLLIWAMPADPLRSVGSDSTPGGRRRLDLPLSRLIALAIATGFSAATATSLASFYVGSATDSGVDVGLAGILLAVGSASVIAVRLLVGWRADRLKGNHLHVVAVMLGLGTLGFFGLGYLGSEWVLVVATALAFAAGWGWPGLFNFAVVSLNPNAPALATSVTQTGVFVGGFVGPALFGYLVEHSGFRMAWTVAAGFTLTATFIVWWMSRILDPKRMEAA